MKWKGFGRKSWPNRVATLKMETTDSSETITIYHTVRHHIPKPTNHSYIVAYLPKARTVEVDKQPLLGDGPYTRSREMRHVRCDVTQQ
jgi:hypothetical protein